MATINLGNIKFKWQGAYNGATAYTVDDVVSYNGSSYICIANSTGNLPTDTSYFEQMSSAGTNGTNGTDLTTTLTTQGDLVYRDGSGLQRLGAGTAGQVLQTGGAGANPSWGTVSSDFVLLATTDASSSASVSFDGYFSSTYKNYQLIISDLVCATNSVGFRTRLRRSNADVTTAHYHTLSDYSDGYDYPINYVSTGSDQIPRSFSDATTLQTESSVIRGMSMSNSSTFSANFKVLIFDPLGTSNNKCVMTEYITLGNTSYNVLQIGQSAFYLSDNQNALSGITFFLTSGNITRGNFKLYGIK